MKTYPIAQMNLDEALTMQFRLVDLIQQHFSGAEFLQAGDFGVNPSYGRPLTTAKVEAVLAEFFDAEDCVLVRGSGTGAIRSALIANFQPGDPILVHEAPVYSTTKVTFRAMGLTLHKVDFNQQSALKQALDPHLKGIYIQHSRQRLQDHYDLSAVIQTVKATLPTAPIMVDDNYTAMAMPQIGCQLGANLSAFSLFKLLGPPGVGCIVGDKKYIDPIREDAYSGGTKVQGPEAMDALKSLVYAPVMVAIGVKVVDEVASRLNAGEVPGVAQAHLGNHQARSLLVELVDPVAPAVIDRALHYGATPYPVGAASRHEVGTMFYRVSKAMIEAEPTLKDTMVRISPFRAGADTIIHILKSALHDVGQSA